MLRRWAIHLTVIAGFILGIPGAPEGLGTAAPARANGARAELQKLDKELDAFLKKGKKKKKHHKKMGGKKSAKKSGGKEKHHKNKEENERPRRAEKLDKEIGAILKKR